MTTSDESRTRIRSLFFGEHWPIGTIAAQLGLHHETVRAAVESDRFVNHRWREVASKLNPFKPFVNATLEQYPRLRATRILQMLGPRGYTGSYPVLQRYVRSIRKVSRHEAYLALTTLPGEQGQVDWGSFGAITIGHARRLLSCFVMVLAWSRGLFARFYLDQRLENFLDGHARAFEAFGGTPRVLLYDNLKSVVLERIGEHVRFHPRLLELAGHYHYMPRPCAPYRGNEKGRVERHIRYLRESFFAARRFRDIDDLNAQLAEWTAVVADERARPGDAERTLVRVARDRERASLLALPEHRFPTDLVRPVASGKTPYVRFDRNDYSIPHTLVRKPLTLVASDRIVRLLDGDTEVARHARSWDCKKRIEQPEHLRALGEEKRRAREQRGRDHLRTVCPAAEPFFEALAARGQPLHRQSFRLGQLLDGYGADALERALREVLDRGSISAESVAHVLSQHARATGVTPRMAIPLPDDPRVRDLRVLPHKLDSYDRLLDPEDGEDSRG